jgi:hypothetical protein
MRTKTKVSPWYVTVQFNWQKFEYVYKYRRNSEKWSALKHNFVIHAVRYKIRLYKILIKPTLRYVSVTWTLTQAAEQMLNTSERKILQRIYGLIQEGGCWRPRWNSQIYSLCKEPNIVEDIKIWRLGWAGHIIRINEERIPKRVLNGNFHTTIPVGRPRSRWADVVQRDALQLLGIRGWRSKAANRDEWRHLMR